MPRRIGLIQALPKAPSLLALATEGKVGLQILKVAAAKPFRISNGQ